MHLTGQVLHWQGYFGDACASEAAPLIFGSVVAVPERAFEYDFFQLPELTPSILTHSVEVTITASFSSAGYGQWAASRPELLLLKVRLPASALSGDLACASLSPICLRNRAALKSRV